MTLFSCSPLQPLLLLMVLLLLLLLGTIDFLPPELVFAFLETDSSSDSKTVSDHDGGGLPSCSSDSTRASNDADGLELSGSSSAGFAVDTRWGFQADIWGLGCLLLQVRLAHASGLLQVFA
jgi:hypothetical protein